MWERALFAAAAGVMSVPVPAANADAEGSSSPGAAPNDGRKPESQPASQLSTVVVRGEREDDSLKAESQTSASKMPLSVRETPQSVTVITQESLRDRQVIDFGQALEVSAGVNQFSGAGPFGGQPGFGFNSTTIRGIPIDDLNDVREDGFISATYFAIPDMAIFDRIEVIKGPNSVVYGRGSAGGLINRIRKKPLEEFQSEIELTAGSFDTYRADIDVTGPLTASGNLLGRVVAAYGDEGSFVDGVSTKRTLLAPSIEIGFTPGTRLLLEGLYQHDSFIPATGTPLANLGDGHFAAPRISRSLYVGVPTRHDNKWDIYSASAQLEQDLGDRWLATLRLSQNKTKSPIQTDRYAYGLSDAGDTLLIKDEFHIDRDIWAGELRFSGDMNIAGKPVKIATGMEFNDSDYHRRGAYAYIGYANIYTRDFAALPDVNELTPGSEYKDHDKAQGYYLQAQVKPLERLSVLMGLRYDRTDSVDEGVSRGTISRKKDSATTGRIGLTYELSRQISAYAVYATSFSPKLFDVGQDGNILDPETGKIYEAGFKSEWFNKRLGINIAGYRIDRENIPVSAEVGPAQEPYSVPSGSQRSQGFELEANGQVLPGLNLSLAYNHLHSRFEDPRDPFYGARPGGTADWQFGAFASYELQSGPLKGLGFGSSVFSIGDRGLSPFQQGTLDGYTRLDLNVFYKGLRSYDFAVSVRNVLDERYIEGADRSGAYAQFGSPTAVLLTVRHRFGE